MQLLSSTCTFEFAFPFLLMSTAVSAAFVFVESSQAGIVGALSQFVAKLSQYIL
jgi:hypothetical protein